MIPASYVTGDANESPDDPLVGSIIGSALDVAEATGTVSWAEP